MSFAYEEPPCTLEEILQLSFSFVNLQKFLMSITNNNKEFFMKISDIYSKLDILEEIKTDLKVISYKVTDCEDKLKSNDETLISHTHKLADIDVNVALQGNVKKKLYLN